jgi:hypothetical protein
MREVLTSCKAAVNPARVLLDGKLGTACIPGFSLS